MKESTLWSYRCGAQGSRVKVGERRRGGSAYLLVWDSGINGYRKRSLGFSVRQPSGRLIPAAVARAKREALALTNLLSQGGTHEEDISLGHMIALFHRDEVVHMKEKYRAEVERDLRFLETFLGGDFIVSGISPREWNAITRARLSGEVDFHGHPVPDPEQRRPVGPRTVQGTLKTLRQLCRFGTHYRRRSGGFLLELDPTRGLKLPATKDPARPVADDARREALLKVADQVHPHLRPIIIIAAYTGRRIGAILQLQYRHWIPDAGTFGCLCWRAASDKLGRTTVVPVAPEVRDVIEEIRRTRPGLGEAFLFPAPKSEGPAQVALCTKWLRRAEELAGLPHQPMGGFHAFRRAPGPPNARA